MAVSSTTTAAACIAAAAVACGAALTVSNAVTSAPAVAAAPTAPMTYGDGVRLAKQATFGPTDALVNHIVQVGLNGWLTEQFAATGSTYADMTTRSVSAHYCLSDPGDLSPTCARDYLTSTPVAMRFYADAIGQNDQLRQRVAWALSELFAVSDLGVRSTAGIAALNQIFLDNAFGNYRDILQAVTLNAAMGKYLDLAGSSAADPNENYARELMQLFSMGVNQLKPDGTPATDATGAPIPNYTSADVHDIARALTGWTYTHRIASGPSDPANADYSQPLTQVPAQYDGGSKTFLGTTVPAGASQAASMNAVINAVFNNASTAPYVSNYLIEQLVTSNPSAAYVARVAAVFANDGAGVRGDMKAVVQAILTDPEARTIPNAATAGKVKEPVLFMTGPARAVGMTSDGFVFTVRDNPLGQAPFHAASVFSFYPTNYPLPLGAPLISPPSKLMTTATVVARHNLAYDWTLGADNARAEFGPANNMPGATGTQIPWTVWTAFGSDVDGQLAKINALMLDGGLTSAQIGSIKAAMMAVTNSDPTVQSRQRAETALYIAATSPLFQIDR